MYIQVRVNPGAKHEEVKKIGLTRLEVSVREPAERNMANERVRELVAKEHDVPLKRVRLISGHTSQSKVFSIMDAPPQ